MAQREIIFSVNADVEKAAEKFRKLEAEQKQSAEKLMFSEKKVLTTVQERFNLEQKINKLYAERLKIIDRMNRQSGTLGNIRNQANLAGNTLSMMNAGAQYISKDKGLLDKVVKTQADSNLEKEIKENQKSVSKDAEKTEKATYKYLQQRTREFNSRLKKILNKKAEDPLFKTEDGNLVTPDKSKKGGMFGKYGGLVRGLSAGGIGYGMYNTIKDSVQWGQQIGESSRNLNVSAEYYQPRSFAGKTTGMNFESAYSAFNESRKNALGGDLGKAEVFKKLGITDISNGEKAFDQLTATLKKNAGDATTLKNAYQILGNETENVVKGIEAGYETLKQLAESSKPSNEAVANVMLLKATFDDLWNSVKAGILEIINLVNYMNWFGKSVAGLKGLIAGVAGFFGNLSVTGNLKEAGKEFKETATKEADKPKAFENAMDEATRGEKSKSGRSKTVPNYQSQNMDFNLPSADQLQRVGLFIGGGGGGSPTRIMEDKLTEVIRQLSESNNKLGQLTKSI